MPYGILPANVIKAWPNLSFSAKAIAGALSAYMDSDGKCWPSRPKLMEKSGIKSANTFAKSMKELKAKGLLEVTRRSNKNSLYSWPKKNGCTKKCDIAIIDMWKYGKVIHPYITEQSQEHTQKKEQEQEQLHNGYEIRENDA